MSDSTKSLEDHYSPATFAASLLNTLAVGLVTWCLIPWFGFALLVVPILLLNLISGAVLLALPGKWAKVGRGMLIGFIASPLTLLIFLPGLLLAQATELV